MPDDCGCCKVCARQLFEDCSKSQPCDRAKGLECNYGGMRGAAKGICRGRVNYSLTVIIIVLNTKLFLFHISNSSSWNQLNQMEDPASTTTRSTRMERTSFRTVNTSAPAWTELLVASPSAPTWSFCPSWAARIQSGSRYPEDAVTSLSAPRRLSWWRSRWKSTEKTAACLKTTSLRGTSWAQSGEEHPGLYLVSTLILDTASKQIKWHVP